jgi:hypothetical protein
MSAFPVTINFTMANGMATPIAAGTAPINTLNGMRTSANAATFSRLAVGLNPGSLVSAAYRVIDSFLIRIYRQ